MHTCNVGMQMYCAFALLSVARDSLCVTVSFHFDYKTFLTQPTVVTGKGTIPSHAACR